LFWWLLFVVWFSGKYSGRGDCVQRNRINFRSFLDKLAFTFLADGFFTGISGKVVYLNG
jgi:hypothetical protein